MTTHTGRPTAKQQAAKPRTNASPPAENWVRDKRGRIITGHLANLRQALERLHEQPTYNAFTREVCLNYQTVVDDVVFVRLWTRIADTFHWQPNRNNLQAVLLSDAHTNTFHPVCQYLDRLKWDNVERLDRWLVDYAGAEDTEYIRAVSALPLIAAVRRIRVPGAKFDELLILESGQGKNKSNALQALCPEEDWFSDDLPLGVDAKVVIERTRGKWIIEAAELHGKRGKETETLKAFLSRRIDGPVRLAYGRYSTSVPRPFVLIGTTNHSTYLKDMTGARRFWPVRTVAFDLAALKRDRDQLWAEAAARERGASLHLPQEFWILAAAEQEARRTPDPWEELLEPLLSNGLTTTQTLAASEIWRVLHMEANALDNRHADRVAAIMERNGYRKTKNPGGCMEWRLVDSGAET